MQAKYLAGLAVVALLLAAAGYAYYVEKVNTKTVVGNNGVMPCSVYCTNQAPGGGWGPGELPQTWKGAKAVGQEVNGVTQPVTNAPGTGVKMTCRCRRSDSTPYLTGSALYGPWTANGPVCPPSVCATGVGSTAAALPLPAGAAS